MRIRIRHETAYTYATPAKFVTQILRLTPRDHEGQHVVDWRIECDADCRLQAGEDAFGNMTHRFSTAGPLSSLRLTVEGEVETFDTAGVVRGVERFPPELFLRDTALTAPDAALVDYARVAQASAGDTLGRLHALLRAVYADMQFDVDPTHPHTSAAESFAIGRGVCQDFAHVFIVCARLMQAPARYVGGHLLRRDGVVGQSAGHAWAEAFVPDLGWVGFDPAHGVCVDEYYVRVACGLDYLDAAPVRGAHLGGLGEKLDVAVEVAPIQAQHQVQTQRHGAAGRQAQRQRQD